MSLFPRAFRACGIHAGIGKSKSKPDLALFVSEKPCRAAGVFTRNQVKAAPVLLSQKWIRSGQAQAILVNSGCANACTGKAGLKDAEALELESARALGLKTRDILSASTGVIGQRLPVESVKAGIRRLAQRIRLGENDPSEAVQAMMTTDTVPKFEGRAVHPGYRIWGCVKGAGMIHPNLATMLSFILTDAEVSAHDLRQALKISVDQSFNCLTVDGDTSTNDSVFILANGMSGIKLRGKQDLLRFGENLDALCLSLAKKMAKDGEGATRRVDISVFGARSDEDARAVARTVATSPLVKTAVFGNDANWGRIMAAIGRSGAPVNPEKIGISFGDLTVVKKGVAAAYSEKKASQILRGKVIPIGIDLGMGKGRAQYFTCDFSFDYVKINAEYRT